MHFFREILRVYSNLFYISENKGIKYKLTCFISARTRRMRSMVSRIVQHDRFSSMVVVVEGMPIFQ